MTDAEYPAAPLAGTPEWDALRRTGIGASEAAAACGLSQYQQTVELYLRKRGELPPADETTDILFGQCMEAGGIDYWCRLNKRSVRYPMPALRHPEHTYMLATPDAEISDEEGLEFKTMGHFRAKQVEQYGLAEVAPEYVLQAQQQMAVMGWRVVRLVALVEKKLHEWPIERNERLIELMIEREGLLWDHIQRGVPPAIDFCRRDALRVVQHLYPEIRAGAVIQLSEGATAALEACDALRKQRKEIDEKIDAYKALALAEIGENYAGVLVGGKKMLRRSIVKRKGYTVEPMEYIDARIVNYDGSLITAGAIEDAADGGDDLDSLMDLADRRLRQAGFLCHDVSASGSRYYVHSREPVRVRVSDHAPNDKTRDWMDRADVRDLRVDYERDEVLTMLEFLTDELTTAQAV